MKKNGFSLAELIIAIAVVAVVSGLLLGILVNETGVFYQQSSRVSQGVGLNDALASIRSHVKSASAVAAAYPETPPSAYTSGSSTLVLKITSIDSSSNLITNTYDYFVYYVEMGRLHLLVFPNSQSTRKQLDQILTSSVDTLAFVYFDSAGVVTTPASASKVKTTLSLKEKSGYGVENNIATSDATLRND